MRYNNTQKHHFIDIGEIIDNSKQQIIADLAELENVIVPKYRNFTADVPSAEFDKVITAIQDHEDKICKEAHDIGSKLRDEVIKQKRISEQKNEEMQNFAVGTEKESIKIIQNNKDMIKACDAMTIMSYKSRNGKFRDGFKESGLSFPNFLLGLVEEDQIVGMCGKLQMHDSNVLDKQQSVRTLMKTPVVLKEIQSPYGNKSELWRIACEGTEKIGVSGDNGQSIK